MDSEGTPWFYNMAGELVLIKNDKIERIFIKSPSIDMSIISLYANTEKIYITWLSNLQCVTIEYNRNNLKSFKQLSDSYGFLGLNNDKTIAAKWFLRDYCFELYTIPENTLLFDIPFARNKYHSYDNEIYLSRSYFSGSSPAII